MVTVVSVLSVVAAIFCMVFLSQGSFSMIEYFIDLPGLIFLALLVIPAVCISGFAKDFGKGLAKAADLCRCIYQSVFICGCCTGYAGCRAVQCAGIYAGFWQ